MTAEAERQARRNVSISIPNSTTGSATRQKRCIRFGRRDGQLIPFLPTNPDAKSSSHPAGVSQGEAKWRTRFRAVYRKHDLGQTPSLASPGGHESGHSYYLTLLTHRRFWLYCHINYWRRPTAESGFPAAFAQSAQSAKPKISLEPGLRCRIGICCRLDPDPAATFAPMVNWAIQGEFDAKSSLSGLSDYSGRFDGSDSLNPQERDCL